MTETATFAGGCFRRVRTALTERGGVRGTTSGSCGGHVENPGYREVCSGTAGHAEAVQVEYDPDRIDYADLPEVLFAIHDPTTEDRQDPDGGSQHRSVIYYHDDRQRDPAANCVEAPADSGASVDPTVFELEPLDRFRKPGSTTRIIPYELHGTARRVIQEPAVHRTGSAEPPRLATPSPSRGTSLAPSRPSAARASSSTRRSGSSRSDYECTGTRRRRSNRTY